MRGKFFFAVAAAVAILAALILSKRIGGRREVAREVTEVPSASVSVSASVDRVPSAEAVSVSGLPKTSPSRPADPEFQQWITDEAKAVDAPRVDSVAKEAEIKKIAAKLTRSQSTQLLQTASSVTAPPGEKILSTYLMVQGGLNTREELRAFISSPLKESGPHEPHSESEINGIREKSLRIMAIDGLFSQAKTDPQAKAALAQAVTDSADPYIKKYAEDKLRQLEQ